MNLRSPNYDLREFSESVKDLGVLEILDAVTDEMGMISRSCQELGFGYMPKKGSKARKYYDDLNSIVRLYASSSTEFREGFVDEAKAMLNQLAKSIISLKGLQINEK